MGVYMLESYGFTTGGESENSTQGLENSTQGFLKVLWQ